MKILRLTICSLSFLFLGCFPWGPGRADEEDFFSNYEAVYMSRSDFEASVGFAEPKALLITGKIYVKGQFLFVNEVNEGFHVFNNSDPTNPENVKFLNAPGATDMAIRDNVIYINQAVDLIAVTVSSETLSVNKRIKEAFPVMLSPEGEYPLDLTDGKVLVNWIPKNN